MIVARIRIITPSFDADLDKNFIGNWTFTKSAEIWSLRIKSTGDATFFAYGAWHDVPKAKVLAGALDLSTKEINSLAKVQALLRPPSPFYTITNPKFFAGYTTLSLKANITMTEERYRDYSPCHFSIDMTHTKRCSTGISELLESEEFTYISITGTKGENYQLLFQQQKLVEVRLPPGLEKSGESNYAAGRKVTTIPGLNCQIMKTMTPQQFIKELF